MTKDDLMANWDRVVTDRRLTLDQAWSRATWPGSTATPTCSTSSTPSPPEAPPAAGDLRLLAGWAVAYAGFMRTSVADLATTPELAGLPVRMAMVGPGAPAT